MRLLICLFFFQTLSGLDFNALDSPQIKIVDFTPDLVEADPYIQIENSLDPGYRKYFLEFHGFPTDREIIISIRRIISKDREKWYPVEKICIRNTGMIMINGSPSGHLFLLSGRGFLPGERIQLRFATAEGDFSQESSLIPNPLLVKNKAETIVMEAELIEVDPALYSVTFPGLPQREQLTVHAVFNNMCTAPYKHQASEVLSFSPNAEGRTGGESELIITRKQGQRFRMSLPWGTRFYHYIEKNKFYKV